MQLPELCHFNRKVVDGVLLLELLCYCCPISSQSGMYSESTFMLIYLRKKNLSLQVVRKNLCFLCDCMRSESMELWGLFLLFFVEESGPVLDRKEVRLSITVLLVVY